MPLIAAENEACRSMPLLSAHHELIIDAFPALQSWRDNKYSEDRAHDELATDLETESTRDAVNSVFTGLSSWKATTQISSRSVLSETLRQDLVRFAHPRHNFRAIRELAHLLYLLAFEAPSTDVLYAIIAFVDAELPQPAARKATPKTDFDAKVELSLLYRAWNTEFYGCALAGLQQMLHKYEESASDNIYSKTVNIIQSSGTGKSRLMAALAREEPSVCFTFRSNGESGYPPGDPEIRRFLLDPLKVKDEKTGTVTDEAPDTKELHTRALALLYAVFEELTDWLERQPPGMSATGVVGHLADLMAPCEVDKSPPNERMLSDTYAHSRSEFKKNFCKKISRLASNVAKWLQNSDNWNDHFNSVSDKEFAKLDAVAKLREKAEALCQHLKNRPSSDGALPPLVVLVFDEARMIVDLHGECDVYTAVRRILGTIKKLPVWTFFLSTNASVVTLGRPRDKDPSGRVVRRELSRLEPYHALPMHLGFAERYHCRKEPGAGDVTLTPLAEVGTAAHMTLYGRPLWCIYADWSLSYQRLFARSKLYCNPQGHYNPENDGHVFAALAARVSLDPCVTPAAPWSSAAKVGVMKDADAEADTRKKAQAQAEAMKIAVDMHLRIVTSMDDTTGMVTSTTASEPVVSDAVACTFASKPTEMWAASIDGLSRILKYGIIDKGTKGELCTRVLFILAIDMLRNEGVDGKKVVDEDMPFQPVRLLDFLKHLLAPEAYDTLVGMRAQQGTHSMSLRGETKAESALPQTVGNAFANAVVHFSRFVATDVFVKNWGAPELLHMLLLEQAALQGAHGQPLWDLLIPVYMGDPSEPFDRTRVTALIVQIKNRGNTMAPADTLMTRGDLAAMFGENFSMPVLFLFLELGISSEKVPEVCVPSNSFAPHVFQARLRGAAERTYAPLRKSPNVEKAFRILLAATVPVPEPVTIAEEICYDAHVWRMHTFWEQSTLQEPQQAFRKQFARQEPQQTTTKEQGSDEMCLD